MRLKVPEEYMGNGTMLVRRDSFIAWLICSHGLAGQGLVDLLCSVGNVKDVQDYVEKVRAVMSLVKGISFGQVAKRYMVGWICFLG